MNSSNNELIKAIFLFIFLFSFSAFDISCKPRSHPDTRKVLQGYLLVRKVVDGDTFWLNDSTSKGVKVRLIGVDAPESRKTFRKEVGYFGKEAKAFLKNLIEGKM